MEQNTQAIRTYHKLTKHRTSGYAPSPGFLDWDSQPDPYRTYIGSKNISLPLIKNGTETLYEDLYSDSLEPEALTIETMGLFFELSLGLSAWKSTGMDRWALRNNPSSGNLHPTESYLLLFQKVSDDFEPGLYHYNPYFHTLEQRAKLSENAASEILKFFPGAIGAIGLSSIHWREEWKYGARAFRYCQHDVGHALGACRYAAATLGWRLSADLSLSDEQLSAILGLNKIDNNVEPEEPDLISILWQKEIMPERRSTLTEHYQRLLPALSHWQGEANQLSAEHAHWPQIERAVKSTKKTQGIENTEATPKILSPIQIKPEPSQSLAHDIIRSRRSAQRMTLGQGIPKERFFNILSKTLAGNNLPFDSFPYPSGINLLIFVHQVEGLKPGLYCLIRNNESQGNFIESCKNSSLQWKRLEENSLPLYCLVENTDYRKIASQISCYQGIAGHSAFSLGMISAMSSTLEKEGAWAYRRLYWEAGLIGQVLYLEAEANQLSGTGIGCFFDDEVHSLLGLEAEGDWQDIYHFTIGQAREDKRITSEPPYEHLPPTR